MISALTEAGFTPTAVKLESVRNHPTTRTQYATFWLQDVKAEPKHFLLHGEKLLIFDPVKKTTTPSTSAPSDGGQGPSPAPQDVAEAAPQQEPVAIPAPNAVINPPASPAAAEESKGAPAPVHTPTAPVKEAAKPKAAEKPKGEGSGSAAPQKTPAPAASTTSSTPAATLAPVRTPTAPIEEVVKAKPKGESSIAPSKTPAPAASTHLTSAAVLTTPAAPAVPSASHEATTTPTKEKSVERRVGGSPQAKTPPQSPPPKPLDEVAKALKAGEIQIDDEHFYVWRFKLGGQDHEEFRKQAKLVLATMDGFAFHKDEAWGVLRGIPPDVAGKRGVEMEAFPVEKGEFIRSFVAERIRMEKHEKIEEKKRP